MKNRIATSLKIISLIWFSYSFLSMSISTNSCLKTIINLFVGIIFVFMVLKEILYICYLFKKE